MSPASRHGLTPAVKNVFLGAATCMSSPKPTLDELRIERSAQPQPRSNARLVVIAVVVLVLAGAVILWRTRSSAVEVRTAAARPSATGGGGAERTVLNASGYVTARRAATVSAKTTGKIIEVLIEEGMQVKAGQVMARLDDSN